MKKTRTRIFAALMAAAAIVLTACSAGNAAYDMMTESSKGYDNFYSADMEMSAASAPQVSAPGAMADGSMNYDAVKAESGSTAADPLAQRKIIRTVRIMAETKTFDAPAAALEALCTSLGGYIESSSRSGGSIRYSSSIVARSANYTLRIPAEKLDAFREGIGGGVNIVDESSKISDITDQYFDVDTRIATLKVEEERLLAMLEKATELEYLITLERRLSEVRYEIESYTGTLRRYDSQVAYSTVHLTLDEVVEYTEVIEAPKSFAEELGIAFRESWTDFADGCRDFAVWFVYAIPTLLVLAVISAACIGVILLLVRRANRRRGE